MKGILLVSLSTLILMGCVYERAPYGYSRYATTITTPVPVYQERYYVPAPRYVPPPPRRTFEYSAPRPRFSYEHHDHHRHRHDW